MVAWIASSAAVPMTKAAVAVCDRHHHRQFHIHWDNADDAVDNTYSTTMMEPRRKSHQWVAAVASNAAVRDDPVVVAYFQLQPLFDHVDQSFPPLPFYRVENTIPNNNIRSSSAAYQILLRRFSLLFRVLLLLFLVVFVVGRASLLTQGHQSLWWVVV